MKRYAALTSAAVITMGATQIWAQVPPEPEEAPTEESLYEPAEELPAAGAVPESSEDDSAFPETANSGPEAQEGPETQEGPEAPPPPPPPPAAEPKAPVLPNTPDVSELPETLREQPKNAEGELSLADWERDDWMLLQPELSIVELNGYFRIRSQYFRRLNFGIGNLGAEDPSRFEVTETAEASGDTHLIGTDMRLRLEPVINVTEKVQVVTTIDILDNVVLGSTPQTVPFVSADGSVPLNILNRTQVPPRQGDNYPRDSILVRRAYARLTALNEQLQFDIGRMPDHWGLGMMINNGDCLDCDFGDVVDRAMIAFKAVGHLFQLSLTIVDGGPVTSPYNPRLGPVYDLARWDDVDQYDVRVQKLDHPDDIRERVLQGEMVVNYGLLTAVRRQTDGLRSEYYAAEDFDPSRPLDFQGTGAPEDFARDARDGSRGLLYLGDAFVKLYAGLWTLEAEFAAILGTIDDQLENQETTVEMFGGHLNLHRAFKKAPRQGAVVGFHAGAASGDPGQSGEVGRGFGALDRTGSQRGGDDARLTAFQFSPDFHIDQLLFRRVIGTVSDAWYVGPEVRYFFSSAVEGRLSANYAQTWFNRNVPGDDLGLGLEIDTMLIFGEPTKTASGGEVFATAEAAVLFPLAGFDPGLEEVDPSFAWAVQGKLFLTF